MATTTISPTGTDVSNASGPRGHKPERQARRATPFLDIVRRNKLHTRVDGTQRYKPRTCGFRYYVAQFAKICFIRTVVTGCDL